MRYFLRKNLLYFILYFVASNAIKIKESETIFIRSMLNKFNIELNGKIIKNIFLF